LHHARRKLKAILICSGQLLVRNSKIVIIFYKVSCCLRKKII